jgi:hypothetical protein
VFGAGIKHAIDQGWLELHKSGTYAGRRWSLMMCSLLTHGGFPAFPGIVGIDHA